MKILKKILLIEILIAILYLFMLLGLQIGINYRENELTKAYIELDNEKEKSYQLEKENERLKTILNNYTIEERRETK